MVKNMTTEEKRIFAEKMLSKQGKENLNYGKKMISSTIFTGALGIVAIIVICALKIVSTTIFLPLAGFGAGITIITGLIKGFKSLNSAVKDASYGKVTYKEYKRLVKSGELENWLSLETTDTAKTTTSKSQTSAENSGVTLSAEELAVLKK